VVHNIETRQKFVELRNNNLNQLEIIKVMNISYTTAYRWFEIPLFYERENMLKLPGSCVKVKTIWASDKRKANFALSAGYSVIVIWEYDIKYHFEKVKKDLCTILSK